MYFVYVLKSVNYGKYYIGQTKNLDRRLEHHNSKHARWTIRYQPWKLVYSEVYTTRSEAMKRERYLKNLKNIEKILLQKS
jgi:putative endonuclease